jgi:NifU-like protein involved in Fe-S cluster formation
MRWDGYSCSLCAAAADVLAELCTGRTVEACMQLQEQDIKLALGGIEPSRSRMECVRLPLTTMKEALQQC